MLSRVHQLSRPGPRPRGFKVPCHTANKLLSSEGVERRVVSYHPLSIFSLSSTELDAVAQEFQPVDSTGGVPETFRGRAPILGDHPGWGLPPGRQAHLATGFAGRCQDSIWQQHGNQFMENTIAISNFKGMFFPWVCTS